MPSAKRARVQHRGRRARCFYDGCANTENLEQLTTKERVAVASALGYHTTIISKFYTIEELTKKHRYARTDVHTRPSRRNHQSL
jgi:hypothetical protein